MKAEDTIRTAKIIFDKVYMEYHRKSLIVNDPIKWLHAYTYTADKEVVGLISALLAFGNAKAFNKKIGEVLSLWKSPSNGLLEMSYKDLIGICKNFRHRFINGETMARLLYGIREILEEYNTIGSCMLKHYKRCSGNLWTALKGFTDELRTLAGNPLHFLLPYPEKGSSCKRLWLYFRWMVRKDEIDIGCWNFVKPAQLIIPLDTHIYQWAVSLRLISPAPLHAKTAMKLTEIFRQICPEDPLRYDFSLCQAGMLGMREKILYDEEINRKSIRQGS